MLLLANTLYNWASFLANRAGTDDNEPFDPSSGAEKSSVEMAEGEVDGFGFAGRDNHRGGPPAHWIELVQRHAPELLVHEDSRLTDATDSFGAENGAATSEVRLGNNPPATFHTDSPPASPGRWFARLRGSFETPLTSIFKRPFSLADAVNFSRKREGGATAYPERNPREADTPWEEATGSFEAENGEATSEVVELINNPPATINFKSPRTSPGRLSGPRDEPEAPAAPIFRRAFSRGDALNLSRKREGGTTGYPGRNLREWDSQGSELDSQESASFVPTAEPDHARESFPSGKRANAEASEMPFENEQSRGPDTGPVLKYVQRPEKAPVKEPAPSPDSGPASELKRPFVTEGKDQKGGIRKETATENAAITGTPFRPSTEHGKTLSPMGRSKETDHKDWPDKISSNQSFDESSSRPFTAGSREKPNSQAKEGEPATMAKGKTPRAEDSQPFNHELPASSGWPSLPGEPERKDLMATSEDRWPTLLENDPDPIDRPLTETRQHDSARARFAERIRRLDREQRGRGWNE